MELFLTITSTLISQFVHLWLNNFNICMLIWQNHRTVGKRLKQVLCSQWQSAIFLAMFWLLSAIYITQLPLDGSTSHPKQWCHSPVWPSNLVSVNGLLLGYITSPRRSSGDKHTLFMLEAFRRHQSFGFIHRYMCVLIINIYNVCMLLKMKLRYKISVHKMKNRK